MTRATIDELEMLNPFELGELLLAEVRENSPDFQYIQVLLDMGCPINPRDKVGQTPLHVIAFIGNFELMKFFVSKGGDIHAKSFNNMTILHTASACGHLDMVKYLISLGVDINIIHRHGWTAWYLATKEIKEQVPELKP